MIADRELAKAQGVNPNKIPLVAQTEAKKEEPKKE